MAKPRLCLDTTVPSAYFDARSPERQRMSQMFWRERLPNFEGLISSVVLSEIEATTDPALRMNLLDLVSNLRVVQVAEDAVLLSDEYVRRGIFPSRYRSDALHVAVAVLESACYLASWNFRHLVKKSGPEEKLISLTPC